MFCWEFRKDCMGKLRLLTIAVLFCTNWLLAACTGASSNSAPKAVEAYLKALVAEDLNQMISVSCADWEAQAKIEYDSFAAVKLTLEGLQCEETGKDDPFTLVACQGSIIANYGAEDLQIDIADRPFQVIQEGGTWRMCGYSQ